MIAVITAKAQGISAIATITAAGNSFIACVPKYILFQINRKRLPSGNLFLFPVNMLKKRLKNVFMLTTLNFRLDNASII